MRWTLQWLFTLLLPVMTSSNGSNGTISVFWNSTNTMFKEDNNDHMIVANLGDSVDFICPYYDPNDRSVSPEDYEYYYIYHVDKTSYDNCIVTGSEQGNHTKQLVMDCSRPNVHNVRSIPIFFLSPIPNMPDFKLNKDYYFISTSRGHSSEMPNQFHGACTKYNMKIVIQVREKIEDNGGGSSGGSHHSTALPHTGTGHGGPNTDPPAPTDPPVTNYRTTRRPTDPPTKPPTTTPTTTTTQKPDGGGNQAHQKDCNDILGSACFPDDGDNNNNNGNTGIIQVPNGNNGASTHQWTSYCWLVSLLVLLREVVCR